MHHNTGLSLTVSFLGMVDATWNPLHRYAQLRDRVSPAFVLVVLASKVSTAITVHFFCKSLNTYDMVRSVSAKSV